jgi:hypothetical protein
MKIKATVIYPIQVSIDIDKDTSIEKAQELIKQEADRIFESSSIDYAYRWRLDFYWFSFRFHYWLKSDDMRAYHNHPYNFITFVLFGRYKDVAPYIVDTLSMGSIRLRFRGHRHYVQVLKPTLTFLITFGKPSRYSFWDVITNKKRNRDKYFLEMGHPVC